MSGSEAVVMKLSADVPIRLCPSCSYPEHGSIACSQLTRIAPERLKACYELRYVVGHRYARDLRDQLGIPKTSRIIGASFQAGDVDGNSDAVVFLIERLAER